MISIAISSYNEAKTIGRAIESVLDQKIKDYEIIVSSPDKETQDVVNSYRKKGKIVLIKDKGEGKPAALNLIFKKARGKIIVLTDGDVFISKESIPFLIEHFKNKKVGAVTGRVVSTNSKKNMFGFWAHLLTKAFHNLRMSEMKKEENVICSGYLYAIRSGLVNSLPKDTLADDAYISLAIQKKGYKTIYEEKAIAYVKYPTNLVDWIRQKKRTASRLYQLSADFNVSKKKSLKEEILASLTLIFDLRSIREIIWFMLLGVMKAYIWARTFLDIRLWKRSFSKVWERVESTK